MAADGMGRLTQDEEIRRGYEAKRVMDEPLLKEGFERVERAIVDAIKRSPAGDLATHHELALSLQLLSKVHGYLAEQVTTGRLADITKQQTLAQRALKVVRGR